MAHVRIKDSRIRRPRVIIRTFAMKVSRWRAANAHDTGPDRPGCPIVRESRSHDLHLANTTHHGRRENTRSAMFRSAALANDRFECPYIVGRIATESRVLIGV